MSDRLNRRTFLKGLAGGVSTLALAACGSGGTTTPAAETVGTDITAAAGEAPAPAAEAPAGVQQVRGLVWSNGPVIDENFTKRTNTFNEAKSGSIQMDLQFLPYDQYWQKIDLAYASNQPYDIYFWDVQAYGHYKRDLLLNQQQLIESKSDLLDDAKYPTKLYEPWKFDGQNLYGMPENIQTMAMFYNTDLLEKAGIALPDDKTEWQAVLAAAQELVVKEGDRTTQFGMDIGALSVWWGLQTLSWAQDKAFFDKIVEPTTFQMTDPVNTASLQFAQDLIWKTNVSPNATQGEALGSDVGLFQSGRCGYKPEGSWAISGYTQLPFKWAMAPLPTWNGKRVVPYWLMEHPQSIASDRGCLRVRTLVGQRIPGADGEGPRLDPDPELGARIRGYEGWNAHRLRPVYRRAR
jgi:multiple sugar transport system substrate-binding protein